MSFVKHVIFDLDGTLIDSAPGIAWSMDEALRACGLPQADCDIRRMIGPPVRQILASVSGVRDAALLDRLEASFRNSYDSDGWRRTACQPGAAEMLWELLMSGTKMWLVTNKPAVATSRILGALRLSSFFHATVCRDSGGRRYHSKADMLCDLLDRARIERDRCLLVGDAAEDWHAAESAGIPCVIVSHGYGSADLPPAVPRIGGWRELHLALEGRMEVRA